MARHATFFCILSAAFWAAGMSAQAETFRPVSMPSGGLVLTAEAGAPQSWKLPITSRSTALHTVVTVDRLGYDPYRTPNFAVRLIAKERKAILNIQSAGFRPPLTARLELWINDTFLMQIVFHKAFSLHEKIDITMTWNDAGQVTAAVGDETQSVNLGQAVAGAELTAAVGQATYFPLETKDKIIKPAGFGYPLP